MFNLQIVSPTAVMFDGEVDFAVFPGSEGQLGILPQHAPLLSTLKQGKISLRQKGSLNSVEIPGGFLEVLKDKVTVLAI